ncbi:hypothetical protein DUNSADRAFT_4502 [Dunaliella salina]|uniref:Secreted protein n=1 Tax=Dunaliella salina TaxID=3046 RepID=A0ABQ7GRV5_DUNSA|nr:hypothetical protein DUNSADRAFT_4502 [Dunaliella salina]|eukprot:KAF5837343.1 hypothetical protein DUNSADRAFT_4502 [Dunaliella salina]
MPPVALMTLLVMTATFVVIQRESPRVNEFSSGSGRACYTCRGCVSLRSCTSICWLKRCRRASCECGCSICRGGRGGIHRTTASAAATERGRVASIGAVAIREHHGLLWVWGPCWWDMRAWQGGYWR